jgi:hypothetical protein
MKMRLLLALPMLGLAAILLYVGLWRHPSDARGQVVMFEDRAALQRALERERGAAADALRESLADFEHHTERFRNWLQAQGLPYAFYDHTDFVPLVNGRSVSLPRAELERARFGIVWIAADGTYRLCAGACGTDLDLIREAGRFFGCRPGDGLPQC